MDATFPCAIKAKAVTANECAGISLEASADDFHKCLACSRGQEVAKTVNWQLDASLAQATATAHGAQHVETAPDKPRRTAWDIVSELTGCKNAGALAKRIHFSKPAIRQCLLNLDAGKLPRSDNKVLPKIAELVGLTLPELLERLAGAASADHIAQPVKMVPPTMMGTDPADALNDTEQAQELLDSAESPPAPASSPPQPSGPVAPLPAAGPGGPAAIEAEMAQAEQHPGDDWQFYGPRSTPLRKYNAPGASITPSHDLVLNAMAVEQCGLANVTHVRLAWNPARCAVGVVPAAKGEPGALTLQNRTGLRVVAVRHFLRRYGVQPRPRHYPITSGPGGMLVITIEQQPAQGEEAA